MKNEFYSHPGSRSRRLDRGHAMARADYLDAAIEREHHREITFYPQGSLLKIGKCPGYEMYEDPDRSARGKVSFYSSKAASRMMTLCNMLVRSALPIFVTVTYPAEVDVMPQQAKRHLDSWGKRLVYYHPESSAIWKLEPQENGSPHFHLLYFGHDRLPWQWVAVTWVEVVHGLKLPHTWPSGGKKTGKGFHKWVDDLFKRGYVNDLQRRHLHAGTRTEKIRSRNGVMCYAGKNYMGKTVLGMDLTDAPRPLTREQARWEEPGRFWGVIGRKQLPISERVVFRVTGKTANRYLRTVRKWAKKKGLWIPGKGAARIYTNQQAQFARLLDWAEDRHLVPLNLTGEASEKEWMTASMEVEPF